MCRSARSAWACVGSRVGQTPETAQIVGIACIAPPLDRVHEHGIGRERVVADEVRHLIRHLVGRHGTASLRPCPARWGSGWPLPWVRGECGGESGARGGARVARRASRGWRRWLVSRWRPFVCLRYRVTGLASGGRLLRAPVASAPHPRALRWGRLHRSVVGSGDRGSGAQRHRDVCRALPHPDVINSTLTDDRRRLRVGPSS